MTDVCDDGYRLTPHTLKVPVMTINPNNTTAVCSGCDEPAVATAIVHIRALFEVAPWMATENYVPGCGLVTFADMKAIQEYADTQFEAADVQASAPRSASAGDGVREALESAADWCQMEGDKLGAIDGYDYRSGEEFGLRKAQIELRKRAKALASNPLEGKGAK